LILSSVAYSSSPSTLESSLSSENSSKYLGTGDFLPDFDALINSQMTLIDPVSLVNFKAFDYKFIKTYFILFSSEIIK
jgi:hypothetical protein